MKESALDKFGRFLVTNLLDKGLDRFDNLSKNQLQSKSTAQLQKELQEFDSKQLETIEKLVANVLVASAHDFLFALEERNDFKEDIALVVDGVNVADESDGLQGEIFGEEGWLQKFSQHKSLSKFN